MSNFNSLALTWLNESLTHISQLDAEEFMNRRPPRTTEETVIDTKDGPLIATDSIKRLFLLRARHEDGQLEPGEWLDPIQETKSAFIHSLINLELKMIPEMQSFRGDKFDISFRKGGVIVWRDKPTITLAA